MMAQWNPLHDLVSLQDRMNRLFEDASQRRASEATRAMRWKVLIGIRRLTFMKTRLSTWWPSTFPALIARHWISALTTTG